MTKFFLLLTIFLIQGCIALGNKKLEVKILDTTTPKTSETSTTTVNKTNEAIVASVKIVNNQLVIKGTGFDEVNTIKVKGNSFNENFTIESLSSTQIIANGVRSFSMGVGSVFDLILDSAYGAATFQINFSLCDSTLGTKGFDCTAVPNDKDVLSYDATSHKWKPRAINGLNYQGAWDATTSFPTTTGVGDYFIVSVANAPYNNGDWIVFNGSTYDHVRNGSSIINVFGRTGAVTATKGDYVLTKMGDVDLTTTAPTNGQYLKFNGTNWVPATIASESDPTVKVFAQTNLPTCTAGQVLKSDGTALTCVTDNAGAAAFSGTANRVVATNGSGALTVTAISDTILGYLSGVTSGVQAQLDAKLNSSSFVDWSASGVQIIDPSHLSLGVGNSSKAVVTSGTGAIAASSVTATELGYVSGVTSAIQTQLTAKQNSLSSGATINGIVYPATGAATLQVPLAPVSLTDAVNKQYVDSFGQWTVNGSDVYRASGNVGIGTASPAGVLDVLGTTATTFTRNFPAANGPISATQYGLTGNSVVAGTGPSMLFFADNSVAAKSFIGRLSAVWDNGTSGSEAGAMVFSVRANGVDSNATTERMRITSSGNVGIGNASPTAKLTLTPTSSSSGAITLTAANAATTFSTSASTTLNVGDYLIPTTTTGQARAVTVGGTGTSFTVYPAFSAAVTGETYTVYPAAMNVNSGKLFVQGSTGNIGSNTTNPQYALEIAGSGLTPSLFAVRNTTSNTTVEFRSQSNGFSGVKGNGQFQIGSDTAIYFGVPYDTERMRITAAGNVGIGVLAPTTGTRLDITGTGVAASSIIIPRDTVANRPTTGVNGMLRYASDTNKFEAFENGAWVNMISTSGTPTGSAGGDLSGTYPNPTITGLAATKIGTGTVSNTAFGYLSTVSSNIQTQINGKEPTITAGTTAQYLRGDKSLSTFASDVIASVLTGLSVATNSAITATDSILVSFGKLQAQITAMSSSKLDKTGGTLTVGTISGVPTPTNSDDVANKGYVDGYGQWTKTGSDIYRTSGNVGVGTSSPTAPLQVASAAPANNVLALFIPGTGLVSDLGFISVNSRARFGYDGSVGAVIIDDVQSSTTTKDFRLNLNGQTRFMVNSLGNAGFGTTSPTARFSVASYGYTSGAVTLTASNGASTFTTSASTTLTAGDYLIPTTSTGQARVVTVGGTGTSFTAGPAFSAAVSGETYSIYPAAMNISSGKLVVQGSTGYVGIGTSSPTEALTMYGTLKVLGTPTTTSSSLYLNSGVNSTAFSTGNIISVFPYLNGSSNMTTVSGIALQSPTLGSATMTNYFGINSSTQAAAATNNYGVYSTATSTATLNVAGYFSASGATNNYGLLVNAGNVGIGTVTPTSPLQVSYTNTASSGSNNGLSITPTYNQTSTAAATDLLINRTETAVGSGNQYLADFQVAGVSKASISNSGAIQASLIKGNVIDNSNGSTATLTINDRSSSSAINGITMGSGTQTQASGQYVSLAITPTYNQTSTASSTDLLINRTETAVGSGSQRLFDAQVGGTSKFTILDSGNVGIGITNPALPLYVAATAPADATTGHIGIKDTVSGKIMNLGQTATYSFIQSLGGIPLSLNPLGNNVGISTLSPTEKLQVTNGNINVATQGNGYLFGDSSLGFYWVSGTNDLAIKTISTERMRINGSGNVGIGTNNPGYRLDVQGGDINASGNVRAAGVALTSDRRWKRNIASLKNSIDKIKQINGVSYDWAIDDYPEKNFSNKKQIGVIAQDVQAVFPELVLTDKQGFLSVNYPALIAPLIEAFKDQQKQIEANVLMFKTMQGEIYLIKQDVELNKREIASLKAENFEMKKRVLKTETENIQIKLRLERLEKLLNQKIH